jgi:hypothetical protein
VRSRLLAVLALAMLATLLAGSGATGAPSVPTSARPRSHRTLIPVDPAAYRQAKAQAEARAGGKAPTASITTGAAPVPGPTWEGVKDVDLSPSDSTGAVGTTRYVEIINSKVGIYDRTSATLATNTLYGLTGRSPATRFLFDPQMIWDTGQKRFFFVMDDVNFAFTDNELTWGFSKTDSPSVATPADWCSYTSTFGAYGSDFPDYPKLGNTTNFLFIGVNRFNGAGTIFKGTDIAWTTKPPAGSITTCPAIGTFTLGVKAKLLNADGTLAATAEPAVQTDASGTGWIVATPATTSGSFLTVFAGRKNPSGPGAQIQGKGRKLTVPSYSVPPSAPMCSTSNKLDTLDGRLEHAVSGIDPRFGKLAVWTAHAVAGGAGSEERWYEISPTPLGGAPTLLQSGTATSASLYVWNGAISNDRSVSTAGSGFGDTMVMGFNTSSASACPAIQMVSKIGAAAQSAFVLVKLSPGPDIDFTCTPCRWGDYSGATPDPAASLGGSTGAVWLTSMWVSGVSEGSTNWHTWNWKATP